MLYETHKQKTLIFDTFTQQGVLSQLSKADLLTSLWFSHVGPCLVMAQKGEPIPEPWLSVDELRFVYFHV